MQAVTSPEHVHQHSLVSSQSKMQFLLHLPTNPNKNLFTIKRHLHTEETEEKNPETRTNSQRKKPRPAKVTPTQVVQHKSTQSFKSRTSDASQTKPLRTGTNINTKPSR